MFKNCLQFLKTRLSNRFHFITFLPYHSNLIQTRVCYKSHQRYSVSYRLLNSICLFAGSFKFSCQYSINADKMRPTGILDDWRLIMTPEELIIKTDNLINRCKKLIDSVGNVPDTEVSYETVLKVLNEADIAMSSYSFILDSSQHISPDEGVRNASTKADQKLRAFNIEMSMRKDVYEKLLALKQKGEALKPQAQRFLDRLILAGRRNGLHLDEDIRKKVKDLNTKITALSVNFMKNLNDVNTTLAFTDEELDGLPEDFLKALKRIPETGKAEVTLKYPHYFPIMDKCKVPETRKKMELAFNTRCIDENGRILEEMRKLRHEVAVLLGYPTHASYKTETLMSGSAETVDKFLNELAENLTPLWKEEEKYLLELKGKEYAKLGLPFDGKLNSYDIRYYSKQTEEIKYCVDHNKLKEYFPLPVVKKGLFDIYQSLLGLVFEKVEDAEVWHEDVELYSVKDSSSGDLLGYFFLDLFPRPNKYGHAACFELQNGVMLPNGTRQVTVSAMVANFTKPTEDKPALFDFDEVVTFFHEFGHVMHHILANVDFSYFGPFRNNMERDFVEAPSQMLENWCWEIEPLEKMSSHFLDQGPIPADMMNALTKSRLANVGYKNLRQIVLARFDQLLHSSPEGNLKELYDDLCKEIIGISPQPGTHFACGFGHLVDSYDAQYYGYLWSEVYSMDMFYSRFKGDNILNPNIGKDYREKVLQPGSSKDAFNLVYDFLGRKPTQEAFLQSKGLKV